jgi:DNA-binding response OmpR family regulator
MVDMSKVMIVDDERDIREMINLVMQKEGYETETANEGADFLEKVDRFNPDLVTLDIMMPGLTTKEILEKLKEKNSNPKIILLTVVRYSDEEKKKLLQMGNIVDYISKPFDVGNLIDKINKQLKEPSAAT